MMKIKEKIKLLCRNYVEEDVLDFFLNDNDFTEIGTIKLENAFPYFINPKYGIVLSKSGDTITCNLLEYDEYNKAKKIINNFTITI